jgi:hypothetical protein
VWGSANNWLTHALRNQKTDGKALRMIVSTLDDFPVGVGLTRAEVLRHVVLDAAAHKTNQSIGTESLNDVRSFCSTLAATL